MATWAESRGFTTAIYERPSTIRSSASRTIPRLPFVDSTTRLDGALSIRRASRSSSKPDLTGAIARTIRLHTLPGTRPADEIWNPAAPADDVIDRPAYKKLLKDGDLDKCGVTLLAGKAVGAPFVGAVAASLAISEVLRLLHGGKLHQLIDLDLQSCEQRTLVLQTQRFDTFNPGYVGAVPS
jgi:hypothetical protein